MLPAQSFDTCVVCVTKQTAILHAYRGVGDIHYYIHFSPHLFNYEALPQYRVTGGLSLSQVGQCTRQGNLDGMQAHRRVWTHTVGNLHPPIHITVRLWTAGGNWSYFPFCRSKAQRFWIYLQAEHENVQKTSDGQLPHFPHSHSVITRLWVTYLMA